MQNFYKRIIDSTILLERIIDSAILQERMIDSIVCQERKFGRAIVKDSFLKNFYKEF